MTSEKLYSYVVLKFVPDAVTGEVLNAGIVFYCAQNNFLLAKMRPSISRLTHAFPGLNGNGLKRLLGWIQVSINRHARRIRSSSRPLFEEEPNSAAGFAMLHFPNDDSSLQWSRESRGFTSDPEREFERIFDRVVTFHDRPHERGRRSDADVWFKYLRYLENTGVSEQLQQHEVSGEIEPYLFDHAIKNGAWHCLEPMSFDLMRPESIKAKAREKFATMSFLDRSDQTLKVYFLLGEPASDEGKRAADTAIKILDRSPINSEIVLESSASVFAERMAALVH